MTTPHLDTTRHPITDDAYIAACRDRLDRDGALVLHGVAVPDTIDRIVARTLASDQVLAVHQPDRPSPRGRTTYTSREMVAVEKRLRRRSAGRRRQAEARVPDPSVSISGT